MRIANLKKIALAAKKDAEIRAAMAKAPKGVAPKAPTPIQGISKDDPFYKSPEYKSFQNDPANRMGTMDMYDSPYFGSVGSGSIGRAQDAAYRKYKGIAEPAPNLLRSSPAQPVAVAQKAINAVPKLNIAPQNTNPAPNVNAAANAASKFGGALKQMRFKSGGNVSKSSSASKRGDGIAQRGKTKGRMV